MAPLTVVQLIPSLQYGGVERGTLEIAKGLVEAGHRSIVIAGKGPLETALKNTGSEIIFWEIGKKNPLMLQSIFRLARFLKQEKPHILHLRSRLPAWIGYAATRLLKPLERPKIITTVHGLYRVGFYSSIMVRGDRIIAVSETAKQYVLAHYPFVDPKKISVIYRGIDPILYDPGFKPAVEWTRQWNQNYPAFYQKKILTLPARISPRKGIEDFIKLIQLLKERGYSIHGLVVGSAHQKECYQQKLKCYVKKLHLQEDISFLGARSDLREILAISHIVFALSRKPESFGRIVVEALSLGRPVIGYDQGGVGEILNRIYDSGCIPPFDQNLLLEKTIAFLNQEVYVLPQTVFLAPQMIRQTIALYEALPNPSMLKIP